MARASITVKLCKNYLINLFVLSILIFSSGNFAAINKELDNISNLSSTIKKILHSKSLDGADFGFMAQSMHNPKLLIKHNANKLLNPASNIKLITSAAALWYLKPHYRFKTEFYINGKLRRGVLRGDLIIKGYGDPSIVSERMNQIADDLWLLGLREIKGNIIFDHSYFDDELEAKGWEQEPQRHHAYLAPVGALSFNYNTACVYIRPRKWTKHAFVAAVPPVDYIKIRGKIKNTYNTTYPNISTHSSKNKTLVHVAGKVSHSFSAKCYYRRIFAPHKYFASALKYYLQKKQIKIIGETKFAKNTSKKLLYTSYSKPLVQIVSDLNNFSNNFIAEMLVKSIAANSGQNPGNFTDGLRLIRKFLNKEVGLQKDSYLMENGSGLNDVNRLSANHIIELLKFMYNNFEIAPEFISSLSVAGARGTIAEKMIKSNAKGKLRAKTGNLTGISSLSGYVLTGDKKVWAFSILIDGYKSSTSKIWDIHTNIGSALASISFKKS